MNHLKTLEQLFEYTKWTKEKLQDEVNKYKTREELKKNNKTVYNSVWSKGLLDELFKNHPNHGYSPRKRYWTKERLQDEVNKYNSINKLRKNNPNVYDLVWRYGLLDELFKNHPNKGYSTKQKRAGHWSKEKLQDEVNKYKTREDFYTNNRKAYGAAVRNKLVDELFKNHTNQGYVDKEEWKENSYVIYVYELEKYNKSYVGLTNNVKRRDKEHLFSEKERLIGFCRENDIPLPKYKTLEENLNSTEARKREKFWLNFYKEKGWEMFNIAKAGGLGGSNIKWTKNKLQKEAEKYETRVEFSKNNRNAYVSAYSQGLLDELFKNHINNGYTDKKISGYWTKEKLQDEANKYGTRL